MPPFRPEKRPPPLPDSCPMPLLPHVAPLPHPHRSERQLRCAACRTLRKFVPESHAEAAQPSIFHLIIGPIPFINGEHRASSSSQRTLIPTSVHTYQDNIQTPRTLYRIGNRRFRTHRLAAQPCPEKQSVPLEAFFPSFLVFRRFPWSMSLFITASATF